MTGRVAWPAVMALTVAVAGLVACPSGKRERNDTEPITKTPSDAPPAKPLVSVDAGTAPSRISLPVAPPVPPPPRGLPETPSPKYNPTTPNKVMLGKLLFFDKRLSDKRTTSCDSCHIPEHGWSDTRRRSPTAAGTLNLRHTPTLYNVAYVRAYRWDGAIDSLEAFILNHWRGQHASIPRQIARRLRAIPEYRAHFARSFSRGSNRGIAPNRVVEALAAFVRTIRSGGSPWDRYELDNDKSAVSAKAIAGAKLFRDTAQCGLCHPPPHYTDHLFHNLGIGMALQTQDLGRAHVTKDAKHTGAFRTPTLRGVTQTAPYFHDGSAPTLDNAVSYLLSGGFRTDNQWIDPRFQPVTLSPAQREELLAFLAALTPPATPFNRPALPPDPATK